MTFGDSFLPVVYSRGASGIDMSGAATEAGSGTVDARGKGAAISIQRGKISEFPSHIILNVFSPNVVSKCI